MFGIEITKTVGKARLGVLTTPHGAVRTPAFMPVGTAGSVKGVTPDHLRAAGSEMILANTYHLLLRPGPETVSALGGLHAMMAWDGPILTDSGGYQVFSLADLRKIDDDGVLFQSHIDGSPVHLSPRRAIEVQRLLGADVIMQLDECPPGGAPHEQVHSAVRRSAAWAALCKGEWLRGMGVPPMCGMAVSAMCGMGVPPMSPEGILPSASSSSSSSSSTSSSSSGVSSSCSAAASSTSASSASASDPSIASSAGLAAGVTPAASMGKMPMPHMGETPMPRDMPPCQALFGIQQGGTFPDLRAESAARLAELDLPGYAVGGLAVGEAHEAMLGVLEETDGQLPKDRPRYLMGVGEPRDILQAVLRGIDMFDCVLPTRNGRNAQAFTFAGRLRLRNARWARDRAPLEESCDCYACRHFSRGTLRHLFAAQEMLGPTLVSIHNLRFFSRLMDAVRSAIDAGTLQGLAPRWIEQMYGDGDEGE
jgi:queuine tRNA-ribosyltransferase